MKKPALIFCLSVLLLFCSLQPVLAAGTSVKPNLGPYNYLVLNAFTIQVYMDNWGQGYVYDGWRKTWIGIPKPTYGNIQPAYTKATSTMALLYGHGIVAVYDTQVGDWVLNYDVMKQGQYFASFSRTATRLHAAQLNPNLALAAGTNWICAYDYGLKKWFNYRGPADDSTAQLDQNLQLGNNFAKVRVLNGPYAVYNYGRGSWIEQR